ncbi:MAG: S-methyl-5-thioribose-1-phosphate isomerase [Candidatus Omnitrophica bacterium]|nr:S-methyl-5-thioribose-1-phosphate isomerase [Candidatus Omnitrophota bacterium]
MSLRTIEWKNNGIKIIDQTRLPAEFRYLCLKDIKSLWHAIKELKVRGAPAIGAAAALGVYLGVKGFKKKDFASFQKELDQVIAYLASSRPTARNLFWGLERMRRTALEHRDTPVEGIKKILFKETQEIIEEDRRVCRMIGFWGSKLIKDKDTVLTVCNAGILATLDYGTALGVIYKAKEQGKRIKVFACETRPLLQGARLTVWELEKNNVDVTLICDNMAAAVMKSGRIDKVIVGADRIAANGDTANKIGTYSLAVLSRYHNIPFYVAAPFSTFDGAVNTGKDIPIEERCPGEIKELYFKRPIAASRTKVFNPAFDVTDHGLITAIITERGIIKPPFGENIKKVMSNNKI